MKYSFVSISAIALLAACSGLNEKDFEERTALDDGELVERVIFEVPVIRSLGDDDETRASLSQEGDDGIHFSWEVTDTVGIYPDHGSQVVFEMSDGVGTNEARFDGGGWALRKNSTYSCYYPFVGDIYLDRHAIPVSFANQEQTGLSNYDGIRFCLASEGQSSSSGALRFSFEMLNTVIRVKAIGLPAGTYTKLTLTTDDQLFIQDGAFGLDDMSITGKTYSNSLEVTLKDFTLTETSTEANPVLIYLTSAPVDLSGKRVTVRVHADDGSIYGCEKTPTKAYEAGAWGGLRCVMEKVQARTAHIRLVWGDMLVFAHSAEDCSVCINGIQHNVAEWGWYGGGESFIGIDIENLSQDSIFSMDFTVAVSVGSFPTEFESVEIDGVPVAIVSQSCDVSHGEGDADVYHYSLTFENEEEDPIPEAVDLGLPSGLKWASFNVGATKPEEYGDYYAWGEIESKDYYSWSTYRFGDYSSLMKYNTDSSNGTVDNKTVLEMDDDVANAKLGAQWRIPTLDDAKELLDNCSWVFTTLNGINGYQVTGPNGNSIFFPLCGFSNGNLADAEVGQYGRYWLSTLYTNNTHNAYRISLRPSSSSSAHYDWDWFDRSAGNSIRPVYGFLPTGLTLDKSSILLQPGESYTLVPAITPDDASFQTITWTSGDPSIATVDNGVVTAVSLGSTIISARLGQFCMATCSVKVAEPIDDSFNPNSYILYRANHTFSEGDDNEDFISIESSFPGFGRAAFVEMKFQLNELILPETSYSYTITLGSGNLAKDSYDRLYIDTQRGKLYWYNYDDESFSFDLSDKGVSYTDPMIMRFSALDDSFSINDLTINCNMSYMKFPYLFAEYYRERDEGLLSTFKGVPDGSKLYYVKAFDSNGDVVYLGYADKAINPETNREEYCWYSHDGIKATYTFANDSAQQGGFLGSVL